MPKVTMPQLGESVAEGTIGRWLKQVGDRVAVSDPLVEVTTDKVNAEVPAPFAGTLTEILVPEGATVPNGAEIAIIEAAERATATPDKPSAPAAAPSPGAASAAAPPAPAAASGVQPASRPGATAMLTPAQPVLGGSGANGGAAPAEPAPYEGRVTPAVRKLARENGLDLNVVRGTGHDGRVTREDVLAYLAERGSGAATAAPAASTPEAPAAGVAARPDAAATSQPPAQPVAVPAAQAEDQLRPMTQMRRAIAAQMTRAGAVPMAYHTFEVDMSAVVRLRDRMKGPYQEREGISLSFVPFVTKAAVEALRAHPAINAHWTDEGLLVRRHVNVGIAVAVDDGLMVPVIRDADSLSIHGLNVAINDLASRARTKRLRLEDLQGGTFTVDNTGSYGSVLTQPILNVPEIMILTMEAIVRRPVVITHPEGEAIAVRPIMNMCSAFDHRATDGAAVGRFMADVKRWLESVDDQTPIW